MSKLFVAAFAAVSVVFFSLPVFAAGGAARNWTGFYAGVHLGVGRSQIRERAQGGALSADQQGNGVIGGGHAGFDWETGAFVLGVEGDFSGTDIGGHTVCPQPTLTCQHDINWIATARPRVGMLAFDRRVLLYATGGLALADIDYKETDNSTGALFGTGYSKTHTGWAAGLGAEYLVMPNVSVRLQYLHEEFEQVTTAANTLSANAVTINPSVNEADVGVSWRF